MILACLFAASAQIVVSSSLAPATYVMAAGEYRSGNRERALVEIRRWRSRDIWAGVQALREGAETSRLVVLPGGEKLSLPGVIDVGAVEAAALMHVEAGLLELQELHVPRAGAHFAAATRHVEWLYAQQAERARLLEKLRRMEPRDDPNPGLAEALNRALQVNLKVGRRPFYATLAAATLALGFPETALPFAEKASAAGPPDGETLLLNASAKESLAFHETARTHEGNAQKLRLEAEILFREALAAAPQDAETHLRLGSVLLAAGQPHDAEPFLQKAAEESSDPTRRYLAFLFLGRATEPEKAEASAAFYAQALEAWPESQAARLGLARGLESSGGPPAARPLVSASLLDSRKPGRERDPWWSYSFGPRGLAKTVADRLWQTALGRSFGS